MSHPREQIAAALAEAQTVLLATHIHPDGDALGSQLALGAILEGMGKKVVLYGEEPVSHLYDFLPGSDRLVTELPDLDAFDCAVALDCGDCFRLGRQKDDLLDIHPFVVIDHHVGHKTFGDIRWVDADRAATGEMVYDLATALGAEIPYEAAYCLYAAIASDTGSFKYSSTTDQTFRVALELVRLGVKPSEVAGQLFDNFTVNRLHLLKAVLATLELHAGGRVAMISVTGRMLEQTGTSQADTENFINYPRAVNTVKVAAFLKETAGGVIGVSLRSKGNDCDVATVAAKFGGGGHRNAAGCKLQGVSIDEVREMLLAELFPLLD